MHLLLDGELRDLRLRDNDTGLASVLLHLRLDISESSRDTEAARQNSVGAEQHLPLVTSNLPVLVRNRHILEGLSLVNLPAIILDSIKFGLLVRPVVLRQLVNALSAFSRQNGSAVTDIGDVALSLYR